jgi:hypothetical protein
MSEDAKTGTGADTAAGGASSSQAAAEGDTKKGPAISHGVQVAPANMSEGVEVFPGVNAEEHNERQRQRRERNREDYQ